MSPTSRSLVVAMLMGCTGKVSVLTDDSAVPDTAPPTDSSDSGDTGDPIEPDPQPYTTWLDPVDVAGDTFDMGCTRPAEWPCDDNERPSHTVTVSSFSILSTEVPRGMYRSIMGSAARPAGCTQDDCALVGVSWYDALEFCNRVSTAEGLTPAYTISGTSVTWDHTADGWRLPTESEWEYAARGNRDLLYAGSSDAEQVAWTQDNSGGRPHVFREKAANDYDLYDMSGNVWEWVWDGYGDYPSEASTNPTGSASSDKKVIRGGGWGHETTAARVSTRRSLSPDYVSDDVGFRMVRGAWPTAARGPAPPARTAAE